MKKVKKACVFHLLLLLLLTACGNTAVPAIDEYSWLMTSVQSGTAQGQAIAYGERGSSTLGYAQKTKLICTAKNGKLTIKDKTNNKTYCGTYKLDCSDPKSAVYDISVDGNQGKAVAAMTTYYDKSQEPTLIIRVDDYAINFFADGK